MNTADGPYFEDLTPGWSRTSAGITVHDGHATLYQALTGDHTRLHCDAAYAQSVGFDRPVLNPTLIAHMSIGQSTRATRAVVANLYYQDARFHQPVLPGATLTTRVEVLAAAEATPRTDRPPRGKVLLDIETIDQHGHRVLSYSRCALVRKRSDHDTGRHDELRVPAPMALAETAAEALRTYPTAGKTSAAPWVVGEPRTDPLRDPVTGALCLVRLTGNEARAHRDPAYGLNGHRLVYGGHTVSLAQAALTRMLPDIVTITAWKRCEHPSPVTDDDLLETTATPTDVVPSDNGEVVLLDIVADVVEQGAPSRRVLTWTAIVVTAPGAVAPSQPSYST